jgi:hypothetical protein
MRTWPGIVLAPLLALADQSVAYALVQWGCDYQHAGALQWVHAAFFVGALATIVPAWSGAMRPGMADRAAPGDNHDRHHFMSLVSLWLGAFSALIILALWVPQWVLSPCFA